MFGTYNPAQIFTKKCGYNSCVPLPCVLWGCWLGTENIKHVCVCFTCRKTSPMHSLYSCLMLLSRRDVMPLSLSKHLQKLQAKANYEWQIMGW